MDTFKRAFENIGRLWAALTATQRVILSAAAALMVLLLVWGSSSGTGEGLVRIAGGEVGQDIRYQIIKKLQESNQRHEIRGSEIFVPKGDADRVVLELSGQGVMDNSAMWDFLKSSDILASQWDKNKRYQVALQQKLEAMIRSIQQVQSAAVVINPGSESARLGFEGPKAGASVQVELRAGVDELSRSNVSAIAGLVAKAVPGLELDQVHLMDTRGKAYRVPKADSSMANAGDRFELERMLESKILNDIKDSSAFRSANVTVRVLTRATDIEKNTTTRTNLKPIEESERVEVRKGSGGGSGGGLKGEPQAVERTGDTVREITSKNIVGSEEHISTKDPSGQIEKISVGVLIPIEAGPDGLVPAAAQAQLPTLLKFVLAAAGPKVDASLVSVEYLPTKKPEAAPVEAPQDRAFVWFAAHASQIAIFALALFGLLVMAAVIRGAMAKDSVEDLQGLRSALDEEPAPAAGDLAGLKENLQEMVGRSPESVATSLKSFMTGR